MKLIDTHRMKTAGISVELLALTPAVFGAWSFDMQNTFWDHGAGGVTGWEGLTTQQSPGSANHGQGAHGKLDDTSHRHCRATLTMANMPRIQFSLPSMPLNEKLELIILRSIPT